jgi:hypothetical protein
MFLARNSRIKLDETTDNPRLGMLKNQEDCGISRLRKSSPIVKKRYKPIN